MHGLGNDYIYIDRFTESASFDPAALARLLADRHRGIGGDGLILVEPSDKAAARMRMFNADGSESADVRKWCEVCRAHSGLTWLCSNW